MLGTTADEIHNARTGQRMRFLERDADDDVLRVESVHPPRGVPEPLHVHPRQESSAHVLSGELLFVVDGVEHRVGPGDTLTIPAGTPHNFVNDGEEEAVSIQEFRPALRIDEFFRAFFMLAERGELNSAGMPPLLRLAELGPRFGDEIRVTRPPWFVQRIAYALLGPVARLRRRR